MREFKLLNLSIFYEEDNELKLVKESIIARKTILGNYKEIITGIKFRPTSLNEKIFQEYYMFSSRELRHPVDVFGDDPPLWAKLTKKNNIDMGWFEALAHDHNSKLIKKYGFAFVLNYKNNDFRNLRIAKTHQVNRYGESFNSTKFFELIHKYNNEGKKYYKQNKKEIKKVIKNWK